ncbi:hypothetical protein J6590_070034 [Homalodisca vitripennis]|nr:hypothetical protein J6590_070034 [Homalodisca vitripennis]
MHCYKHTLRDFLNTAFECKSDTSSRLSLQVIQYVSLKLVPNETCWERGDNIVFLVGSSAVGWQRLGTLNKQQRVALKPAPM